MTDVLEQRSSVIIHCDGSCNNVTRKGAWAAIVECPEKNIRKQLVGSEDDTTSSRMELLAALSALSKLKNPCKVRIISDSQYVVNAFNKGSIDYWEKHFWTLKIGGQVKNQDLWKRLLELTRKHEVTWQWIKGHDKNTENDLCHKLAFEARSDYTKVRKKSSPDCRKIGFIKCLNCNKPLLIHCYPENLQNRRTEFKSTCPCGRNYVLTLTEHAPF